MSQVIHTICMSTSDALEKREGEFHMQLAGDQPRINAVKLALGSLELPIVQWTIEDMWSLLYFSEGYRLTKESSYLRILEKSDNDCKTIQIQLPLYINEIEYIRPMSNKYYAIKTIYPHGLWIEGRRSILPAVYWGNVEIVCSSLGRISISQLLQSHDIEYLSEHEFMISLQENIESIENYGYLYMPTIPSPKALCDLITFALTYSISLGVYSIAYDPIENRASLLSTQYPPESSTLSIKLYGSKLAQMLGYFSDEHFKIFQKKTNIESNLNPRQFEYANTQTSDLPLVLPSEVFPGWMSIRLTPGWYAPAHRPMCTGAPLRISTEIENAFNRLHFTIPERVPKNHATSHFIVFCDPTGTDHICPIYAGKYTPETLCSQIEDEMTRLASRTMKDIQFSVDYDYDTKRFTFSCEAKQNGIVVPVNFMIHFNHPASIDSAKLGFPNTVLRGSDTYTSSEVYIPRIKQSGKHHFNSYKISEIGHQKRFMMETVNHPAMTCLIKAYDEAKSELLLMTYGGQLPYVHGLQKDDVVTLLPTNATDLFHKQEDIWITHQFQPCPIAFNLGKNGVVTDLPEFKKTSSSASLSHTHVRIKVKNSPGLASYIGCVLNILCENEPFNLCFGNLPKSIPSRSLGFGKGAIQWGIDGTIKSGNLSLPPYEAAGVHSLDHPDYVLLYIEEGKKNNGLQHRYGNTTTSPFAKLVLYPMFREERMLPRDTTLLGSEYLSTFTLKFKNPDGTPYHFHNIDFSFSLNFIRSAQDS